MAMTRLRALGLRKKILFGYGIVLLLIVLVFFWAIHNLLRLGSATDAILSENYRSILAAENMIDALERQDSGVLLYILGYEAEGVEQFQANERKFLLWFARARDNITIKGEAEIVATIDTAYAAFLDRFTNFLQTSAATGQRLPARYHESLLPAFMSVRETSTALRDLNQETMYQTSERARRVARRAIWSTSLVSLFTLGLGFVFSLFLSNRLVSPIRNMRTAAVEIARGNYDVEVPPGPSDELGALSAQFNQMAAQIRAYRDLNIEKIVAEKRKADAIIHSIDDGILAVDSELRIVNLNPAAAVMFGVNPEDVENRHFLEVIKNDQLFTYVQDTIASGRSPEIEEEKRFFSTGRDAEEAHYQFSVTPVYTTSGTMLGAILVVRDVTKLKELDRLKSEFVATASHELKTPLTSIGMSVGLLRERVGDRLDPREMELLDVAADDVERLRGLVKDLLDLSRIEAGKIEMEFNEVPVSLLFEKAIQTLGVQAEERSVSLSCKSAEELPYVRADANKITWVLTNLISNALRYSHPGGCICLSSEPIGSKIHLSVKDNGEGIPYEYQPKIFEKFVQVKGQKAEGGSGLGLAICKEIVRAHGGSIWVDSTPGVGSTFTFTLPIVS